MAQEEKVFDKEDQNNTVEDILRKLSAVLNNDLRHTISSTRADIVDLKDKMGEFAEIKVEMAEMKNEIVDMKEYIASNERNIVQNSDSIAERNSSQITSMSEEFKQQRAMIESLSSSSQQHENMMVNNIQRLNIMTTKLVDMKVKSVSNDVQSTIDSNSALIASVSEDLEQKQAMIEDNIERLGSMTIEMADIKQRMENIEANIVKNSDTISDDNTNFSDFLSSSEQDQAMKNNSLSNRGTWCGYNVGPWDTVGIISYEHLTVSETNMNITDTPLDINTGNYCHKCICIIYLSHIFRDLYCARVWILEGEISPHIRGGQQGAKLGDNLHQ